MSYNPQSGDTMNKNEIVSGYQQPPNYAQQQQINYGYANQPPPPNIIVVNQPVNYGVGASHSYCSTCSKHTQSKIIYKSGLMTWLICLGLCIIGCFLGCCLIPFCVDDLKDKEFYCVVCNTYKGDQKVIK